MPTYTVQSAAGSLSAPVKAEIARVITATHARVTGAPAYVAQVVFRDVAETDHFVGGRRVSDEVVFVHGQIRDGRTPQQRTALLEGLVDAVAAACHLPTRAIWVYVVELPSAAMVEYGHVLPPAGGEDAWLAAMPDADRAFLAGKASASD